jgi:predicted ATPase
VSGAIAKAVRLTLGAGDPTDQVVGFLTDQAALVILDNCEHVIDSCAEFAERFLQVDGASVMLATSREALDVDGERIVVLGTLPSNASDSPGVQLFVDRATAVDRRFVLTEATSECVASICTRLDGLPLAIELAAVRVTVMSPSELLAALDDRFEVLSGGRRRQRHRTLKATLDWSYDLLGVEEQRVLRACGVFVDGFDIEAVAAVAEIPRPAAVQLIGALVAKSLVAPVDRGARSRFGLLETVREYAKRRLADAGEEDHVRSSHLEYFHRLAYVHGRTVFGEMRHGVLLRPDRNNLTAAFEWAAATGRWVTAGELIVGCYGAYVFDGYLPEATVLIDRAIAACETRDSELAGYLRAVTVQTLTWTGDRARSMEVCRALTASNVSALRVFGWALLGYMATSSEADEARHCVARASAELESASKLSPAVEAEITGMLTYIPAVLAANAGDQATGFRYARQTLALQEANDYRTVLTVSATQLASACEILLGDPLGALRTLATLDPFDLTFFDGDDIRALAYMALGDLDEARHCVRNHAERATTGPVSGQACDSALLMAALAHAEGDTETAIVLLFHMGIGRHAATRMFSAEFARRLGVTSEFADHCRRALSYARDSEQGPTGAHLATAAVRRELARRGWN